MKRILFVDDSPNILSALQRMLHKMRSEWEMIFAESGREALEKLAAQPFDAVISDMRMPEMNGAQLLKKVQELYPGSVRFILSGYSDRDLIIQSVGCTHQYLAKPCDPDVLISTIKSSFALRELLANDDLCSKIAQIPSLPALPQTYSKLVAALGSETTSIDAVAKIIANDVGMTMKVLHLVNSAFFGLPTHVDSPLRAVSLLGLETIKALVLTAGVFEQFTIAELEGISLESVYTHSMAVGVAAQGIAKKLKLEKRLVDNALLAGMMHDIGKPIMLMHFRDEFKKAIDLSRKESILMHVAEKKVLGVSHAEIGAYLLSLWGESDSILEAVAFHHGPVLSVPPAPNTLTATHIGNALQHRAEFADINRWKAVCLDMDYLIKLGLVDGLDELAENVLAEAGV